MMRCRAKPVLATSACYKFCANICRPVCTNFWATGRLLDNAHRCQRLHCIKLETYFLYIYVYFSVDFNSPDLMAHKFVIWRNVIKQPWLKFN